tara:strand:- start:11317 stop:11904 length:588 start_codon:yes stop_codon:yes gene_type:complete
VKLGKFNLEYNPLGNLTPKEVSATYHWNEETIKFLAGIRKNTKQFYCIEGKKGVGKTSLLQVLSFQLNNSKYISFQKGDVVEPHNLNYKILIIDRVYNLKLNQRMKLWTSGKIIIYSAHIDTYGLEQIFKGSKTKIKLGRQNFLELKEIVNSKLSLLNFNTGDFGESFSDENIMKICEKHSGNPRGVINELYFRL